LYALALVVLAFVTSSCSTLQSSLKPAGPQARRILGVWTAYYGISIAVWALVMIALALAITSKRRRALPDPRTVVRPDESTERVTSTLVASAGIVTVVTLFVMLVVSVLAGHAIGSTPTDGALEIRVIGHQWWWEVHYPASPVSMEAVTANEIHIPVGRRVRLELQSGDVIHSFWVPALAGKRDMIPGHTSHLVIEADEPGRYRGQCAEFCGLQHAHMVLWVIADRPREFAAWLDRQRAPARNPSTPAELHGQQVFLNRTCVMCHTIQGTIAGSNVGPDLTHVASRRTIAAGSVPNVRGHLTGWIVDPHGIKPGVNMPANLLAPGELNDLVTYLETLQ
jgi:cytochrome c oxidase subunit 2